MAIKIVCWDLDDTLIPNTHKYFVPTWKCGRIIAEALGSLGPQPMDVLKLREEIDMHEVKVKGFTLESVPWSWVLTYQRLCEQASIVADQTVIEKLRKTAAGFAKGPFTPFRSVRPILQRVAHSPRKQYLVTTGPEDLQWRKIREAKLEKYFDQIHVVPSGKKRVLEAIRGDRPSEAMMIGDSLRSDIAPAVELGMTAVLIARKTWGFAEADVDATKYHRLEAVTDLPELLKKLEAA